MISTVARAKITHIGMRFFLFFILALLALGTDRSYSTNFTAINWDTGSHIHIHGLATTSQVWIFCLNILKLTFLCLVLFHVFLFLFFVRYVRRKHTRIDASALRR